MSLKETKNVAANRYQLEILVDGEKFREAIREAYRKSSKKINVPGFRKGKAPRAVIEKMYGKEVFYEDAANEIIPDAYEKAYDECGEDIVSTPEVEVVQLEAGKPFIFTATVALKPEIKLGKYKGVKVAKADTTVSDDEVMAVIEKERENSARSISVERPVQAKDEIILDFEGFVDGVAFAGGKGENYPLTIGSGSFIPGFEDQLIGAEVGKEVTVKVKFPEDYHAEDLKGKDAEFKCTVKEVKEKELPALDDEFAAEVSEYDTFDEYKAATIKSLQDKKIEDAKNKKEDEAIDAIIKASEIDIPAAMLDTKKRQMIQDYAQNLRQQGLSMEQYFQFTGMTADKLLEQVEPQAKRAIESRLVLENIVKAEKIEASEEDFENELKRIADAYKMEVDKVKEMIDDNAKKQLLEDLAIQKAVEFVVTNAKEA